jgi:hypothetical protein
MSDYLLEYWYNCILSGPPTHLVNTISNTGWLTFQVPHRALVAGIDKVYSKVRGKERVRYLNEIVPMLAGYKSGTLRGRKAAWQMAKEGKVTEFETKWAQEIGHSIGAFERSKNKLLRKAAPLITAPTRALRAMDVWANSIAYDARARVLARRAANKKGLRGEERTKFEQDFIEHLSDESHEDCMKAAKYATFMDDPDPVTQSLISLREKIPWGVGRFVVPFVNTISNLTKRGVELTPGLGIVKEAASRSMGRGQPTPEVIAKQIEGAVLTLYILHKCDVGEITGPLPESKSEREAFYRQGKKPWGIRIGDNWYQYRRIEPFNTVIASVAIARDKILNAKDDKTKTDIFLDVVNGLKDNLIDSSYFQGVQQVLDKYGRAKGSFQRWTASWVPYSSFWRSINRAYEVATEGSTKVREGDDWLKSFSQTIPGLSKKMPAKIDIWGEEIELPGGIFRQWLPYKWSKATDDPVELELEKLGVYPGLPKQKITIDGKDTEFDDDIYRNYCLMLGKKLKERIAQTISSPFYSRVEDIEKRKKMMNRRIRSIRFRELTRAKREQAKKNRRR